MDDKNSFSLLWYKGKVFHIFYSFFKVGCVWRLRIFLKIWWISWKRRSYLMNFVLEKEINKNQIDKFLQKGLVSWLGKRFWIFSIGGSRLNFECHFLRFQRIARFLGAFNIKFSNNHPTDGVKFPPSHQP